ncbi:MAG: lamin tail domain-containing protein, partial [Verrucomicrobia bacterium]|nr:lamin tail domain-containing protein [Verrucomicrobiota bacterium]
MSRIYLAAFVLLLGSVLARPAEPLLLSEFMANNTKTLKDEDGAFSDWIEIQNASATAVNVGGWHLTDSASHLMKWTFPSTNIGPGEFLLVFASAKNRSAPGAPLHTNFKLDANNPGSYLALVKPDGVTVATEFVPQYPPQLPDISYGFGVDVRVTSLVSTGSVARIWVPKNADLGSTWIARDFDDSLWQSGPAGVGYDTGAVDLAEDGYASQALGAQPLVYYRFSDAPGGSARNLGILDSSDGQFSGTAQPTDPGPRPPLFAGFEPDNLALRPGASGSLRIPFQPAFNRGTGPFTVELWFLTTNNAARGDLFSYKGPGGDFGVQLSSASARKLTVFHNANLGSGGVVFTNQWQHLVVTRDETNGIRGYLNGVRFLSAVDNASMNHGNDLLFGSSHSGDPAAPAFAFNGAIDEAAFYDRALATNEIVGHFKSGQAPLPLRFGPSIGTDVRAAMQGVNATVYLRFPFTATNVAGIDRLKLRARYDDGFVAFLNGVEVGSANAPETLDWNSQALRRHPDALALQLVEFDLNSARDLLVEGANVLAIQGLNVDAANVDFLIQPELEATDVGGVSSEPRYFLKPTPGGLNGRGTADLGPIISAATHSPDRPSKTNDLVITARVAPAGNPLASVTLRYRVMFLATNSVAMLDDGLHGDGKAGDGVFGAVIPFSVYTNSQMVRWFITAADTGGRASRWPLFEDPTGSPQYLGTVVTNPGLTNIIPLWEWYTTDEAGSRSRNGARGSLCFGGRFYDNVFIRQRGGATTTDSQKFDFNDGDEFALNNSYTGIREANLNRHGSDSTFVRPALAFETYRRAGLPACLTEHVLMRLNGKADRVGLYVEQVDKRFLNRNGLDPEGALYKMVQRGSLDPVFSDSTDGVEKKTRRGESNADLQSLVDGIRLSRTAAQRAQYLFDNVNMPDLMNYLSVRCITMDADDVRKNFYLYRDTNGTGEWSIFPWDKDWTFGIEGDGAPFLHHPFFGDQFHAKSNADQWNVLWTVIFNDARPREMFLRRLRTLMDEFLQPPGTSGAVGYYEQRARFWAAPIAKLPDVADVGEVLQWFPSRRDDLYKVYNVAGDGDAQTAVVPFAQPGSANLAFGDVDFNPTSESQDEEFIQLVNPNSFAMDVSGWVLEGGVSITLRPGTVIASGDSLYLSPNVVAFRSRKRGPGGNEGLFVQGNYSGRLSARGEDLRLLDRHGRLVASLRTPSQPSLAQLHLRVTEIMFHPAPPPPGSAFVREDFEYIALTYAGPVSLSLAGLRFTQGIEFDFNNANPSILSAAAPPGAGVGMILVRNRAAFESRYGTGLPVAGEFTGTLSDHGETLRLEDSQGEVVFDFAYDGQWFPLADGAGLALTADPAAPATATPGQREYWTTTASETHRPGTPNEAPDVPTPAVYVNELLANSGANGVDKVELYAPQGADIGGWYLTDDLQNPKKYRFPDGVLIAPGGFLVVDESEFNKGANRFAFSSAGESVYVIAAAADGSILPWAHGYSFGPSDPDTSFGAFITSEGKEHFVLQKAVSLGQANPGPAVGPLVISEIQYHPPDLADGSDNVADEFVELTNLSDAAVALSDVSSPPQPWRIRGGIDFMFPSQASLPAGGRVVIVSFDPQADPAARDRFRAIYAVPDGVPLLGPYRGKLNNHGDSVELVRPALASTNGSLYVTVDAVNYRDDGAWPTLAGGTGASIQRRGLTDYLFGDDPAQWSAAAPTAGRGAGGDGAPVIVASPTGDQRPEGGSITLSVVAAGAPTLRYQWLFREQVLVGETSADLVLADLQAYH